MSMKSDVVSSSDSESDSDTDCDSGEETVDTSKKQQSSAEVNPPQNIVSFYVLGAALWATFSSVICALQDMIAGTERSSGLMLIAAIAPALVIKIVMPVFFQNVAYMARILFVFVFVTAGILCAVFSGAALQLKVVGVCFISAGTGAGEVSLLILTITRYRQVAMCSYIAGSGSGVVAGALVYVGLTTWSNIDPCSALLISVMWPAIFIPAYVLQRNRNNHDVRLNRSHLNLPNDSQDDVQQDVWMKWPFRSKRLYSIWCATPFILALFLNCFAEYTSVGAILTTVVFSAKDGGEGVAPRDHYGYYLLSLYTGEFLGRSLFCMFKGLVPHFKSKRLWIALFSPLAIMIFFVYVAWYRFVDSIWVVFFLCFVMGASVGVVHASCYTAVARNTLPAHIEVVLTLATIAEAAGMLIAGLLGLHGEQHLYWHCRYSGRGTTVADCLTRSTNPLFWAGKTRWPY